MQLSGPANGCWLVGLSVCQPRRHLAAFLRLSPGAAEAPVAPTRPTTSARTVARPSFARFPVWCNRDMEPPSERGPTSLHRLSRAWANDTVEGSVSAGAALLRPSGVAVLERARLTAGLWTRDCHPARTERRSGCGWASIRGRHRRSTAATRRSPSTVPPYLRRGPRWAPVRAGARFPQRRALACRRLGLGRCLAGQQERVAPGAAATFVLDLDSGPAPELGVVEAGLGDETAGVAFAGLPAPTAHRRVHVDAAAVPRPGTQPYGSCR